MVHAFITLAVNSEVKRFIISGNIAHCRQTVQKHETYTVCTEIQPAVQIHIA